MWTSLWAVYLVDKVEDGVNEDVECRTSRNQERSPPPSVVLIVRRETENIQHTVQVEATELFGSTTIAQILVSKVTSVEYYSISFTLQIRLVRIVVYKL